MNGVEGWWRVVDGVTHIVDVAGVGISLFFASVGCFAATGGLIVLLIRWIWGAEPSYRWEVGVLSSQILGSQTCRRARATPENMAINASNGKIAEKVFDELCTLLRNQRRVPLGPAKTSPYC